MKFNVPGNLLLLGEFAVTLEGGLGIACTVDRFVTIEVKEAPQLKITSSHSDTLIHYTLKHLFSTPPPLEISVDSRPLFRENGEKLGLGSSAAVVAGLTMACLTGITKEKAFPKALAIHRAFQGGRGSGYDVAASLFGIRTDDAPTTLDLETKLTSFILFKGGVHPSFELFDTRLETIQLISGKHPVSTKEMLIKFEALKDKESFLQESNEIVLSFLKNRDLKGAFERGKALHETLHRSFGVDTSFPELDEAIQNGAVGKPLGSGYELGAIILP